jgi:glycosyltransferase involved in cell wall biosynthesis
MKILATLDFPPQKGGMQRYLHDTVRFSYAPGDLVLFVYGEAVEPAAYSDLRARVQRAAVTSRSTLVRVAALCVSLRRAVRSSPEAVVECGNVYAGVAAWLVSVFKPVRYTVYTYGTELVGLQKRTMKAAVLRHVLRRAAGLFVLGRYTESLLRANGIQTPAAMHPPKIVQPPCCRSVAACGTQTGPSDCRILTVGRLVRHKGHQELLRAAASLPAGFAWHLTIVGDGPEKESLTRAAMQTNTGDRVSILSGLSDEELAREYHRATVLVLPSLETTEGTEGFGIVLLEAMAHRVPIVASRIGGIPEVLDDGACGLLVAPGDSSALAAAIQRVAGDQFIRTRLTRLGYERLVQHYAWPQ